MMTQDIGWVLSIFCVRIQNHVISAVALLEYIFLLFSLSLSSAAPMMLASLIGAVKQTEGTTRQDDNFRLLITKILEELDLSSHSCGFNENTAFNLLCTAALRHSVSYILLGWLLQLRSYVYSLFQPFSCSHWRHWSSAFFALRRPTTSCRTFFLPFRTYRCWTFDTRRPKLSTTAS